MKTIICVCVEIGSGQTEGKAHIIGQESEQRNGLLNLVHVQIARVVRIELPQTDQRNT